MNAETIKKNYEVAKERYAALGVDTDKAIAELEKTPISLHLLASRRRCRLRAWRSSIGWYHDHRQLPRPCTQHRRATSGY